VRVSGSGAGEDRFEELRLGTLRGEVACRYYRAERPRGAAVFVGGVGGGWDTPARGLYPRLCGELPAEGIACLRVRFRFPTVLEEAVHDVVSALGFLREDERAGPLALVGHSFGGAVTVRAAAAAEGVRTVVTLATQAYGAEQVAGLGPGCSILLLHGAADTILPVTASEHLYRLARDPKELAVFPGAGHSLDAAAEEVHRRVRGWIVRELRST
jgi:pimeloyl-ACP methyl ester carboxylesterase